MVAAVLGWVGTIGTFVTYVMVSRGHLAASSIHYAVVNAIGGALAGAAGVLYGAWPSAAANFAWALVALHTLWICIQDSDGQPRPDPALVEKPQLQGC